MRQALLASVLAVLAVPACGNVDTSPDAGPGADASPTAPDAGVDTTAPRIVSMAPYGESGITADAVIQVVFSEPMDAASVRAAWSSPSLPAAAVELGWNAAGDVLTVTPSSPLGYNEGVGLDPSVVHARVYAYEILDTATDRAGNRLAIGDLTSFTTLRRMHVELAAIGPLTRTMRGDGLVLGETAVTMAVGDTAAGLAYKTFLAFALPVLPAGAALEAATLAGSQNGVAGDPYGLGDLAALHVTTGAALDAPAFSAPPLADLGAFSTSGTPGPRELDVTAPVADDLANHAARGERSQYRLEYPVGTDADGVGDEAHFARSSWQLALSYLVE